MKYFRSLVIFFIGLNINQVHGKNLDYFLKSNGDEFNYFIQTAASLGIQKEKVSNIMISTEQNSPMTITAGFAFFPSSIEKLSLLATGSLSYIVPSDIKEEGGSTFSNNTKLDPETGFSFHAHKSYTYRNVTGFFGGLDHEVFYLYNTPDFLGSGKELKSVTQKITYGTLGLAFAQKFFTPFVFKISASQSFSSKTGLKGQRYLIDYSQKYSENMWYHIFVKRHELQDDLRELKITRLGVGVGFYY